MSVKNRKKPNIVVSDVDYERLMGLANSVPEQHEEIADELMAELDRAKVVPAKRLPQNVVHMGSVVEFRSNDGHERGGHCSGQDFDSDTDWHGIDRPCARSVDFMDGTRRAST
jgi:transcription elongation GreA/GreB family factor